MELHDDIPSCAICLCLIDVALDVAKLQPCLHIFHSKCISRWAEACTQCPLCKSNFCVATSNFDEKVIVFEVRQQRSQSSAILDSSELASNNLCRICAEVVRNEDSFHCDNNTCSFTAHTQCLGLAVVPTGDWTCRHCTFEISLIHMRKQMNREGVAPNVDTFTERELQRRKQARRRMKAILLNNITKVNQIGIGEDFANPVSTWQKNTNVNAKINRKQAETNQSEACVIQRSKRQCVQSISENSSKVSLNLLDVLKAKMNKNMSIDVEEVFSLLHAIEDISTKSKLLDYGLLNLIGYTLKSPKIQKLQKYNLLSHLAQLPVKAIHLDESDIYELIRKQSVSVRCNYSLICAYQKVIYKWEPLVQLCHEGKQQLMDNPPKSIARYGPVMPSHPKYGPIVKFERYDYNGAIYKS